MRDLFYILLVAVTFNAMMWGVISYHNREGGYCDQVRGTEAAYKIDFIMCK